MVLSNTVCMKKILFLFLLLLIVFNAFAQKTVYDPNAVLREVKGFRAIKVSDGIDVFLSAGSEAVAISASEEKYRDRIKTVVDNGVLKIWYDDPNKFSSWSGNRKLRAYVSFATLNSISASGGCDITVAEGVIKGTELSVSISGGSDFKGRIDMERLDISQSGGSDVSLNGRSGSVLIDASGGSDFNGFDLLTDYCTIDASGGSDVEITVNKELSASASGASDISYKGAASVKESKASGASSVNRRS